jgi:DNA-binding transcriptional MerR regulator
MATRKGQNDAADEKMTIGELARRTGMTIRNIRAHQTRGLLPPPEVHGRTGYYNQDHVARIELTREMQAEGLNLEAIRRVLESSEGSSREMVDFARAVRAPFEDETPEIFDEKELADAWGVERFDPKLLRRTEKLGILRQLPDGKPAPLWSSSVSRPRLPSTPPGICGGTPKASPKSSSSSSSRRSGSRSTKPAVRRRTGRRCARRSTVCARLPLTRCWRCSRSPWASRPRKPANAPFVTRPNRAGTDRRGAGGGDAAPARERSSASPLPVRRPHRLPRCGCGSPRCGRSGRSRARSADGRSVVAAGSLCRGRCRCRPPCG